MKQSLAMAVAPDLLIGKGRSPTFKLAGANERVNPACIGADNGRAEIIAELYNTGFASKNFLLACKGEEKTRSPFEVAAPLSQVLALSVTTRRLNTKLEFNRKTKRITNSKIVNDFLTGPPPRKGWEQYYHVV